MITWKSFFLAGILAVMITTLSSLLQTRYPDCGPTQDCPTGRYSGWPMAFKFSQIECIPGGVGGEGCAARSVYRYAYKEMALDFALSFALSGLGLSLRPLIWRKP